MQLLNQCHASPFGSVGHAPCRASLSKSQPPLQFPCEWLQQSPCHQSALRRAEMQIYSVATNSIMHRIDTGGSSSSSMHIPPGTMNSLRPQTIVTCSHDCCEPAVGTPQDRPAGTRTRWEAGCKTRTAPFRPRCALSPDYDGVETRRRFESSTIRKRGSLRVQAAGRRHQRTGRRFLVRTLHLAAVSDPHKA